MYSKHLKIIPSDTFKCLNKTKEYSKLGISKQKLDKFRELYKTEIIITFQTNSSYIFDDI